MLAKTIAIIALMFLSWLLSLGNYWFVFGIWPKSWPLFVVFCTLQGLMLGLIQAVGKSK